MDLALTLDYELFGDGSGNVFTDIIIPTQKLLDLCDKRNAKVTIFFEVVEYWKLRDCWGQGVKMGYSDSPARAMENQMINAYKHGHDVQLHIHPQWLSARFIDNAWKVNDDWCMKDIPLEKDDVLQLGLREVLLEGKATLEKMIRPLFPKYNCNIFRAGGFNILPSKPIIKILGDLNFKMDSSVFAGGYDISKKSNIDFREIKNNIPYWYVKHGDVLLQKTNSSSKEGIVELPIFASPVNRYAKYDLSRIKIILKNKKSAQKTLQGRIEKKTLFQKLTYFIEKEYITWDFCLFNIKKMKGFLAIAKEIDKKDGYHPFVLIGHSKGFYSNKSLKFILNTKEINFITLTDVLREINNNEAE
jgi:hypothetical protein